MQTIDIKTTQNVTIEYELASLRERIFAFFIDLLIMVTIYMVVFLTFMRMILDAVDDNQWMAYFLYGMLPVFGFVLYQFLSELLAGGQSWGKRAAGLRVVRLDGREPSLNDYLLRAVFHIFETLSCLGIMAAILISSSAKHQRLGDMTANTTVIRQRNKLRFRLEDILRIETKDDYTVQYPNVQQLSEQDMLTIKSVITRARQHRNPAHQQVVDELTARLQRLLEVDETPKDKIEFLKILLKDYIVLTR